MRLLEKLVSAEQKSVDAMRRGMDKARMEWGDLERRMRQRMRVYPQKTNSLISSHPEADSELDLAQSALVEHDSAREKRNPIVSIRGRDITTTDLNKTAA